MRAIDPIYDELAASDEGWLVEAADHFSCSIVSELNKLPRVAKISSAELLRYTHLNSTNVRDYVGCATQVTTPMHRIKLMFLQDKAPRLCDEIRYYEASRPNADYNPLQSELKTFVLSQLDVSLIGCAKVSSRDHDKPIIEIRRSSNDVTRETLFKILEADYMAYHDYQNVLMTIDDAAPPPSYDGAQAIATHPLVTMRNITTRRWDVRDFEVARKMLTWAHQACIGDAVSAAKLGAVAKLAERHPIYSIDFLED